MDVMDGNNTEGEVVLPETAQELHALVGGNITRFRELRGLSKHALARETGISRKTIQKWEDPSDPNSITTDKLLIIAKALRQPLAAFFQPCAEGQSIEDAPSSELASATTTATNLDPEPPFT